MITDCQRPSSVANWKKVNVLAADSESDRPIQGHLEGQRAALRHCTILSRRVDPIGDYTARAESSSLKQIVSRHWKPSGYSGTQRQLPLWYLWAFLCVKDRAICVSSYTGANLSLLWSKICHVDGSVHHRPTCIIQGNCIQTTNCMHVECIIRHRWHWYWV